MNLHMSAIKESDFQNIQLALQQKDPFLAEKVLKISGSYNIQGPNLPLGAPFLRTFTRSSNIPADLAQEILRALQAFSQTSDGLTDGLGLRLVQAWQRFTL